LLEKNRSNYKLGEKFMSDKKQKANFIDRKLLNFFNAQVPPLSDTERVALESGDVCYEGSLLSGKPDWNFLLKDLPPPSLTQAEQDFLDGPVEEFCKLLDDWKITESNEQDMPKEAWDFAKKHKFLGMCIPEKFGGLGFSARAHSEVVMKIASRSFVGAINVMVPNSLGPGELITHYGTEEQKEKYLERLAEGKEIPCFALTEPNAGSDATSIEAKGVVYKNDEGETKIKVNFEKRYITLAPIATLVGLAFQLEDPDNLLGKGTNPGITVGLVPKGTPGLTIGRRHKPSYESFNNGPLQAKDMDISVDDIIGGVDGVGQGWKMLVENLSVGRAISLPAVSVAGMKSASRSVGAYSKIRSQFGMSVGKFEGVEESLARIAGLTYLSNATREFTLQFIDDEKKRPAIPGAIVKYHMTENMRTTLNDAMDIEGGKGIMKGPGNHLVSSYAAMPIAITVEGANIMTRNLIIFGQGLVRSHPFVLDQLEAANNENQKEGAKMLKGLLWDHGMNILSNARTSRKYGKNNGRNSDIPVNHKPTRQYYGQINRLSAAFNFTSNVALLHIGGDLKRKERLSARLGDVMSNLYMASAALRKFELDGRPEGDLPLVRWSCEHALNKAEEALEGVVDNYPSKLLQKVLRNRTLPKGRTLTAPSDKLDHEVAKLILEPGDVRDRLTQGIFMPEFDATKTDSIADIEYAFDKTVAVEEAEKKLAKALYKGQTQKGDDRAETLSNAFDSGVLSQDEVQAIKETDAARRKVIMVDDFAPPKL
jgi:acyl-CoA dehydrogenase